MTHSITLNNLVNKLQEYINNHPEDINKEIYFDCLHINGSIVKIEDNLLELI